MKKPIAPKKYQLSYMETAKQRIAQVLFNFPEKEFSLSELAKLAKVAKANIGKILVEFEDVGFIEITRLSNLWRIKANQNNWYFLRSKIVYNLNFIYR